MSDVIVFLGIQGSGKGTQAKLLADLTGFQHVNIGDLFREQIARKTPMGLQVQAVITRGDLVSDALVFDLVSSVLGSDCRGVIFDGFPRTLLQAEYLIKHYNVKKVYYLDLSEEDAIARIEARRMCSVCGKDFNLISRKPKVEGVCDSCSGTLIQRADDTGEAIKKRVKEFYQQTFSLKEFFCASGVLVEIPALLSITEIQEQISRDMGLKQ